MRASGTMIVVTEGCTSTGTVAITVNALPTAMAMTTAVCGGEDVMLSATGGASYMWSDAAGSMTSDVTIPGAMAVDGDIYTVTVTNDEGCTSTAEVTLTVAASAMPTITTTIDGNNNNDNSSSNEMSTATATVTATRVTATVTATTTTTTTTCTACYFTQ